MNVTVIKMEGLSLCTALLQSAIDKCAQGGGGEVRVPSGEYITGMLILKSGVTLYLEEGAVLLGSDDLADYPKNPASFVDAVDQERGKCMILAYQEKDIAIEGEGEICGRGELFGNDRPDHNLRPFLIRIVKCENAFIKNVKLTRAAAWCLHIAQCRKILVENITIDSRVNDNNDGIDVDSSLDVQIRYCHISSGDDAICLKSTSMDNCENIMIENCEVSCNWAGFKIGTESVGDFRNIYVRDCLFRNVLGCAIKLVPVDGAIVDNVLIDNVKLDKCTGPIFVSTGERRRSYSGVGKSNLSTIRNLIIRNVSGTVIDSDRDMIYRGQPWGNAKGATVLSGISAKELQNIVLENFQIEMPGGILAIPEEDVPEMGSQYPEFHLFGILPASVYIRHAQNVSLRNIDLTFRKPDMRPIIVQENVQG